MYREQHPQPGDSDFLTEDRRQKLDLDESRINSYKRQKEIISMERQLQNVVDVLASDGK